MRPTPRPCLRRDAKGKIGKGEARTSKAETKSCTETEQIPEFGVSVGSAAQVSLATAANRSAIDEELALATDVFGPSLNAVLVSCATDPAACACQSKVAKRVDKLASTKLKTFLKCKKLALKVGKPPFSAGAATALELEACLSDAGTAESVAADAKQKVAKAIGKLKDDIAKRCSPLSQPLFPGACLGLDGDVLGDCLDQRVECRVCRVINAVDGLAVDCDLFDDGASNGSCPGGVILQETVDIASGAEPAETPGSPGVMVENPKLLKQFGAGADLNRARYTRFYWHDTPAPDAVLILVPGFEGGAGDFKILAENLLVRSRVDEGQVVEVWAYDRRSNQLEDTVGLDLAEETLDAYMAVDWLFGGELGLLLHPQLAAGPGRRSVFYNSAEDVPFLANWTNLVFSQDIDAVVSAAHTAVGNGNVFLGGHSAGTGFTARYAATDFDLTGAGPAQPGYANLRGLVLLEGGGGSTSGTAPSADTLDRIEARFDGGLFGAVRDQDPRCVDGDTPCTVASEATDCSAFTNTKCTEPTGSYAELFGLLNARILAAVEPAAMQGVTDPDTGQIILQVDFGAAGNNAVAVVPQLNLLGGLLGSDSTVFGGIGGFIDDDGAIADGATFVATSVGALGEVVEGRQTWLDINESPLPPAAFPDNGPPPTVPVSGKWGQEKEVTDFRRMLGTFYAGGTNFTDWYYPSSGLGVTSGLPSLDSSALSVGRGRRDIENLVEAANIDIPVIGFGGTNGLVETPGDLVAFASSIATCAVPTCDGSTVRVVDANNPSTAFPTFGNADGGFEVYMSEGFAHVDVLTAEDNADNGVIVPLATFLERHSQ